MLSPSKRSGTTRSCVHLKASVAGAKGGVRTARVFANPELSVAPGFRRSTDGSGSENEFHGNFELSQLFEFLASAR